MDIIRVAAKSHPHMVAGAIAAQLRERHHACVQAIGAGAVNQAVKAIIVARTFLQAEGLDLVCIPTFVMAETEGAERTAVQILVEASGERSGKE